MECEYCTKEYNSSENKPFLILPCVHTFCLSCLKKLGECPKCGTIIESTKPNYSLLELVPNLNKTIYFYNKQIARAYKNKGSFLFYVKNYNEAAKCFNKEIFTVLFR